MRSNCSLNLKCFYIFKGGIRVLPHFIVGDFQGRHCRRQMNFIVIIFLVYRNKRINNKKKKRLMLRRRNTHSDVLFLINQFRFVCRHLSSSKRKTRYCSLLLSTILLILKTRFIVAILLKNTHHNT